jgi:hypothetical protein
MAQAAVPLLVGTGVQILGAKMGWDPRLTAFASIAAGGIGSGMMSGAFAGGSAAVPGVAAMSPGAATNAFNPATTGVLAGSQAGQTALASRMAAAGGISTASSLNPMVSAGGTGVNLTTPYNPTPYYNPNPIESPAIAGTPEVKAPFFDRNQYEWQTEKVTNADGTTSLKRTKMPVLDDAGNPVKGMSTADSLGVSMLDTFLQYELALAKQPPPRIQSSGGGGGGGGGGASGPAYQGGSGGKKYQVVDFYGTGGTASYQPQPI